MNIRLIIITVPPPDVVNAVENIRRPLCRASRSLAALAYPPHVTLRTGAHVPAGKMPYFLEEISHLLKGAAPFRAQTGGLFFGRYETSGVSKYIAAYRIVPSTPLLALHRRLLTCNRYQKGPQAPFHPHMTLAFDDLTESAWRQLKGGITDEAAAIPQFQWICDNVSFYHCTAKRWKPYHVCRLENGRPDAVQQEPDRFIHRNLMRR